jgi:hypothetical protein
VNAVLAAVRGFVTHAVSAGQAGLLAMVYELTDERDLPEQARGEDARMGVHEPDHRGVVSAQRTSVVYHATARQRPAGVGPTQPCRVSPGGCGAPRVGRFSGGGQRGMIAISSFRPW